jgi:hypothetical protein
MIVKTTSERGKGAIFWWVSAYCVLVGGFAGWRGKEFWSWPNSSLVVVPPAVVALALAVRDWWRNPRVGIMILSLVLLPVVAAATIGGLGLMLAWGVAEWTGRWSEPALRAAAGAVLVALGFGLTWAAYRPRRAAGPREPSGAEGTEGPA